MSQLLRKLTLALLSSQRKCRCLCYLGPAMFRHESWPRPSTPAKLQYSLRMRAFCLCALERCRRLENLTDESSTREQPGGQTSVFTSLRLLQYGLPNCRWKQLIYRHTRINQPSPVYGRSSSHRVKFWIVVWSSFAFIVIQMRMFKFSFFSLCMFY